MKDWADKAITIAIVAVVLWYLLLSPWALGTRHGQQSDDCLPGLSC